MIRATLESSVAIAIQWENLFQRNSLRNYKIIKKKAWGNSTRVQALKPPGKDDFVTWEPGCAAVANRACDPRHAKVIWYRERSKSNGNNDRLVRITGYTRANDEVAAQSLLLETGRSVMFIEFVCIWKTLKQEKCACLLRCSVSCRFLELYHLHE